MRIKAWLFFLLFFTPSLSFAFQQLIVEPEMGRKPLLQVMAQSRSSIDLVMYGFTDIIFSQALIHAQHQGKKIRVLLQQHPYKAKNENIKTIQLLKKSRINLKWPSKKYKFTHQKTFIFDNTQAIIMTFNLTKSSFENERNFALIINEPGLIQEIQQVFDNDWQYKKSNITHPNLVWSPENSREKLLGLIREAKTDIEIYADGLTDYQIIGALAKAAHQGVKVRILTNKRTEESFAKKFNFLNKAGVVITYDQDYIIHAKVIMLDHKKAVLGSINFTKNSINNNRELAIITEDSAIIHQLENVFTRDWDYNNSFHVSPNKIYILQKLLNKYFNTIRKFYF